MALDVSGFFSRTGKSKNRPAINQIPTLRSGRAGNSYTSDTATKKQFWSWFKSRPELNAPINIRTNDTITQPEFFSKDGKPLGRNKRLQAERFWNENFMPQRLKSVWFDVLVTGDGYGWKGKLSNEQLKEVTDTLSKKLHRKMGLNQKELSTRLYLKAIDEDLRKPRIFDYVASSTVEIVYDNYDILSYVQNVGGVTEEFSIEDILHFKLMSIDGKVTGYTPVQSLSYELILLWFIKENMMAYMRNGGDIGKIFVLKEEYPQGENYQFLVNQLMDNGAVENRHGDLVLTGEVDIHDLNKTIKDMEYKDLALYVAGNVAYAMNIPVTRIPYMIGQSQSAGDAGGLAEAGYWSMIESDQHYIETILNTQLFNKHGYMMRFKKPYKIDTLREAQVMTMKADSITKYQSIFNQVGKKLKQSKIASILDISLDDLEEMSEEDKMNGFQKTGLMNQNLLNNTQLTQEDKVKKNDTKKQAANNTEKQSPGVN